MELLFLPVALLFLAAPVLAIVATVWASRLDRRLRSIERDLAGSSRPRPGETRTPATDDPIKEALPPSGPLPPAAPRASGPPRTAPAPKPPPAPVQVEPGVQPAASPASPGPPSPPAGRGPIPPRAATSAGGPPGPGPALEMLIGIRWFNVAGIVTLLFAVAFFLKYAYENAWIGPRGRVGIGILSGLAAILLGEATRRRGHRVFSQGLSGGGIAALYLSFFFSFRLYQLIEVGPAFGLMVVVTACGLALAILQDSLAVAFLSFLGAYLTPVLLSTGQDAAEFLFTYLAVLALGGLGVSYFKRWRALDLLSFIGTCALYTGWYLSHYSRERLGVAAAALAVFFFVFLLVPYGHNLARRVAAGPGDHLLALANAFFTFGFLYRMIHPISPRALGFIALALAACYLGLGIAARRRLPEDRHLAVSILGIGLAFLTLAIPLHLGLHAITIGWASQGLVILYLGFRYREVLTRLAGLAVLGLAILRLLMIHTPLHVRPFTIFWNPTFGTWALVVAAVLGASWMYRRHLATALPEERHAGQIAAVAGLLLLLLGLNLETSDYFDRWSLSADHKSGAIMLLWSFFPLGVLAAGRYLRDRAVQILGTVLTICAATPFIFLIVRVMTTADALFGNFVFWAGLAGAASFLASSAWHRRFGPRAEGVPLWQALAGAGVALLLVLLTAELYSHFNLRPGTIEQMAGNHFKALLAVSVLWAIYAAALMAVGFGRSIRACRYAAFGLFGATLLKVFFMDMRELEEIYRILSFVILGILLVGASFAYSRFRSRIAMTGLWAALATVAGGTARADFEPAEWRYLRAIEDTGAVGPGESFAWVVLDEEILSEARPDLADLRVIGRDGREVPHVT